jgi:hypothetical protein
MVRLLIIGCALLLSGCQLTLNGNNVRPDLTEPPPEIQIQEMEYLDYEPLKSFDFPEEVAEIVQSAEIVTLKMEGDMPVYVRASEQDSDNLYIVLSVQDQFKIRDLYQSARENKALVDKMDRIQRMSVEERNQLLRVLKAESYRMERMKAFNEYYKDEIDRLERSNVIDTFTWKLVAILALAVGL